MTVEELEDGCRGWLRVEGRATVSIIGENRQGGFYPGFFKSCVKELALLERYGRVFAPLHDEKGCRVLVHKIDGACTSGLLLILLNPSSEKLGNSGRRAVEQPVRNCAAPVQKIGRPEPIHDALHFAGLIEVRPGIEIADIPRGSQQRHQMTARGSAPSADAIGLDPVFRSMRAEETDSGFAVFDLSRVDRVCAQPVVDAGDGIPIQRQPSGRAAVFTAAIPSTAMNPYHQRARRGCRLREVKIEPLAFMATGDIWDVAQQPNPRHCGSGRRGGRGLRSGGLGVQRSQAAGEQQAGQDAKTFGAHRLWITQKRFA